MKNHTVHLYDMLGAIEAINGIPADKREDYYYLRALERDMAIIGEAANRLPADFHTMHPQIPWRQIINLRHVLVHGYDKISPCALWEIVDNHLPPLSVDLQTILQDLNDD